MCVCVHAPQTEHHAGNPEGDWDHDMFVGSGRRRGGGAAAVASHPAAAPIRSAPVPLAPIQLGTRVMVTNLDKGVGADDLREIFARVGVVKAVAIHYADDGSSKGVADVTYRTRAAAEAAITEFDGRQVDDSIIRVRIVGELGGAPLSAAAAAAPVAPALAPAAPSERRGRGAFEAAAPAAGPGPAYYAPAPVAQQQRPQLQFGGSAPDPVQRRVVSTRGGPGGRRGRGGGSRGGGSFLGGRGGAAPASEGDLDALMEAYRAAATR